MEFNVLVLNAWVGMARGHERLPKGIHDLGFTDFRIAKRLPVQSSDNRSCVPEIILWSVPAGQAILIESKSGRNIEKRQAETYGMVTSQSFASAQLPTELSKGHTIFYLCQCDHKDTVAHGLTQAGVSFPILAVSAKRWDFLAGSQITSEVSAVAAQGFDIREEHVPSFFKFDENSPDTVVVAAVLPHVVNRIIAAQGFTAEEIAESVDEAYKLRSQGSRAEIRGRVLRSLRACYNEGGKRWLKLVSRKGNDRYEIRRRVVPPTVKELDRLRAKVVESVVRYSQKQLPF